MTKIINFADYQKQAARTMKPDRLLKEDLADYAMGLSGEVGELLNKIKKNLFHHHFISYDEIAEEIGDCLWYLHAIATKFGLDMGEIAWQNIEKLKKRYPHGYTDEDSRNRIV